LLTSINKPTRDLPVQPRVRNARKIGKSRDFESRAARVATFEDTMDRMQIEWDETKAALNLQKHGVSFEDATLIFYDLGRIETYDGREDYNEDRWATIGLAYSAVLYVVYTVREEETIRIISARKAVPHEQKQYREANH
jgi:uncharacterized DUF497 family protein